MFLYCSVSFTIMSTIMNTAHVSQLHCNKKSTTGASLMLGLLVIIGYYYLFGLLRKSFKAQEIISAKMNRISHHFSFSEGFSFVACKTTVKSFIRREKNHYLALRCEL